MSLLSRVMYQTVLALHLIIVSLVERATATLYGNYPAWLIN